MAQKSFRITHSSRERRTFTIRKKNAISPTAKDIALSQILVKEGWKSYKLYLLMYKWYEEEIVAKRKYSFVFEPWMSTTDSLPNNNDLDNSASLFAIFPFFRLFTQKIFPLLAFLFLGFIASTNVVYGQNQITGIIKSVPNNDPIIGKITFEDVNTGIKYAKAIDATGQFSIQIPEGTYQRKIEGINNYLFIDTLNIMSDTVLNKEIIKNLPVNSTVYQNLNKSFLWLTKKLTNTPDNNPNGQIIHRWIPTNGDTTIIPTFIRRNNPSDPISMPQTWTLQYDTLMNYLTNNNPINDKLQLEEKTINDSLRNIQHLYVINNSMPIPGTLGYTIRGPPLNDPNSPNYGYSQIFMNRQFLLTDHIVQTGLREFTRSFGLESNSIDPAFVMYMSGNNNRQLHPDEINILRTLYSLTPGTDMFPYKDSVTTVVNMPPIVTASLPNLNILQGSDETFLAKLSQHFGDPENSQLNYIIHNGEFITANLRKDSLFVKPEEWFTGLTNIIVEAYDADGNGQFATNTSEINVIYLNHAPTKPIIINPQNGETITTKDYTFKWTKSRDEENDQVTYTIGLFGETNKTGKSQTDTLYKFNNLSYTLGENKNYKLIITASDGLTHTISDTTIFNTGTIVGIEDAIITPSKFELSQNYPNPFNPSTVISYSIPTNVRGEIQEVRLMVYDILGNEIATLVNENQKAGNYEVIFNASHLPTGLYIYRLISGSFTKSMKMLLIK